MGYRETDALHGQNVTVTPTIRYGKNSTYLIIIVIPRNNILETLSRSRDVVHAVFENWVARHCLSP